MTSSEKNLCPKCGKETKSSGSITQWIVGCNCANAEPSSIESGTSTRDFKICLTCGKRVEAGRPGSFTQWIFRADICQCSGDEQRISSVSYDQRQEHPQEGEQRAESQSSDPTNIENFSEAALEVSPDKFPVDRYLALSELGKGSTGTVYLAWDRLLGKKVAVKCLNILTAEQMVWFQREAKATSKLDHPNIIKIMDFGSTTAGSPYMVMEYFHGTSLEEHLEKNGPMEVPLVLSLYMQVADCLAYAHKHEIYHRDIKPSNLLLHKDENGSLIKLIDFGVAQAKATAQEPTIYQGKNIVGTPRYMSPDQVTGASYDERSEVYSLGCVMFETLVGQPPFDGETPLEIIYKQVNETPPTLREAKADLSVPEPLERLVASMIEKDPQERPTDMLSVRDILRLILEPEEVTSNRPRPATSRKLIASLALIALSLTFATYLAVSNMTPPPKSKNRPPPIDEAKLVALTAKKFFIDSSEFGDIHMRLLQPVYNLEVPITDADLKYLALSKLPLDKLQLSRTHINGDGFVYLLDSGITTLDLTGLRLKKEAFTYLCRIKSLARIILDKTNIDDASLSELAKKTELSSIYLRGCAGITDKGICSLANHPNIGKIDLEETALTDAGLVALGSCKELSHLFLNKTSITDAGLLRLSGLKRLRGLNIGECPGVTGKSLQAMDSFPNLDSLDISNQRFSARDFSQLERCKKLKQLGLHGVPIDDQQMKAVGKISTLRQIYFQGGRFTDAGLKELYALKRLKLVTLLDCPNITRSAIKELNKNVPAKCQVVSQLTGADLPDIYEDMMQKQTEKGD